MKVLYAKCENGHFYDANQGEKCPKCGSSVYTLLGEKSHKKKEDTDRTEKKKEKEEKKSESDIKADAKSKKEQGQKESERDNDRITGVWENFPQTESAGGSPEQAAGGGTAVVKLVGAMKEAGSPKSAPEPERDDTKTIAFWDRNSDTQTEPVVGWLVCIKGGAAGNSYELRTGANKVGRLENYNDVVISGDMQISGKEHLVITFEPKMRKFYLQQGGGMSLSYLNGALLNGSAVLGDRDRIELGSSTLVFVPLCGDSFGWDN